MHVQTQGSGKNGSRAFLQKPSRLSSKGRAAHAKYDSLEKDPLFGHYEYEGGCNTWWR